MLREAIEHVRADGGHHVHEAAFDEFLLDSLLGGAGVGGGVGHDQAGPSLLIQHGVEELNPQVIEFGFTETPAVRLGQFGFRARARCSGVVVTRQAEGEAAARTGHVFQPFLVHGVDVERRVGEDEIELASGLVRVVVVAVDLAAEANVAFKAMHGEVQAAKAAGFVGFLVAVDAQFPCWVVRGLSARIPSASPTGRRVAGRPG